MKMKKQLKKITTVSVCVVLTFSLAACGKKAEQGSAEISDNTVVDEETSAAVESDAPEKINEASVKPGESGRARPMLMQSGLVPSDMEEVTPAVPEYTVEPGLKNIMNTDQYYLTDDWIEKLVDDGFFVRENGGGEFFEVYESNRYRLTPSYVTVDSLMHTYHVYYAYLMRCIEKDELYDKLVSMTDRMLTLTKEQNKELEGLAGQGETAEAMIRASERNIAFFAVARALLDETYDPAADGLPANAAKITEEELELIEEASEVRESPLFDGAEYEDYSQYKPRGYYDTDEKLKKYFKAMMWYGRRNFTQENESLDMSALLMTAAMDDEAYSDWERIYAVTSFFAGASDDSGICEYTPLIEEAYGKGIDDISVSDLTDETAWNKYHDLTAKLDPPAINSVPQWDDGGETDKTEKSKGYRFMGQRFSIDAAIFQKLIYSAVKENKEGDKRMLPDALDVPAALGSRTAEEILKDDLGAFGYEKYGENLKKLQADIGSAPEESWYASLYSGWLNTLRPLLEDKGKGYPMFMQGEKWKKKSLESFLGSYTELKHDTVLYSKQVMAEMGGGYEEEPDDRGYVEPYPLVYARFKVLAEGTASGLEHFGVLSSDAKRDLGRLQEMADTLRVISEKELKDEVLSDDEYEFIRIYGGEIEHFWQEAYKDEAEDPKYMTSREFPAPLVVDVATDPNGSVLELATGNPALLTVIVPVDGTLRIATGAVYSFYEFTQPLDQRMTDHEWRVALGIDPDDDGEYHWEHEDLPDKPAWTESYRGYYED